ncbi:MAG TPA: hypothetical protein VNE41_11795, partial [Chitinophagaceae bacterium]|nr:hypothetical protein [Chitinophagaceae bacterium]
MEIEETADFWHSYHNVSESYYHIQLTIKYRKPLFKPAIEGLIAKVLKGLKERYSIEVYLIGFDKN